VLAVEVEAFAHAGHEADFGGGVGFESGGHGVPLDVRSACAGCPGGDTAAGGGADVWPGERRAAKMQAWHDLPIMGRWRAAKRERRG
jgi:hypothetical protein